MALPEPEPGLVISYHEHESGQQEGRKDRPSVIVLAVERASDGATIVTVLPITQRAPASAAAAVEIPPPVKNLLGLDRAQSWIVVSEGNEFVWPGYDLRPVPGRRGRYDYGFLPPRFFDSVIEAFGAWHKTGRARVTGR